MVLGDATPKRLLTPQLSRRTSEYSTPRRTSSGLGVVGPSDLLSPTELAPPLRQTSDTQKAAAPSSGPEAAAVSQSEQDAQPASSALDTPTAAPLGTMTSSAGTPPSLHEGAQARGPAGSLVSAQQPAGSHDSFSSLSAESASRGSQGSHSHNAAQFPTASHQLHRPLVSPAADMASRAYPLPAAPLEEGVLSTSQSSDTFDAHIATAPTPYPSLASDFSQPGSPASPQGGGVPLAAALKASLASVGKASTEAGSSSDGKSRLAFTTPGQGSSSKDGAATDARGTVQSGSAANNQAGASSTASEAAAQNGGTAASERLAEGAQDLSLSEVKANSFSEQEQQAAASSDVDLAGLKLEDADSEQLQLALAISLGKQEGEAAHESAQGFVQLHDQPSVSPSVSQTGPASETLQGEFTPPATGSHTSATDGSSGTSPACATLEAGKAGNSSLQTAALPATPAGSAHRGQHAESAPAEALLENAAQQTPDQAAPGAHEAFSSNSAPSGLAQQGIPDQQQPHLLAAQPGASEQEGQDGGEHASQPDRDGATPQQPSKRVLLPGTLVLVFFSWVQQACQYICNRRCCCSAVYCRLCPLPLV